MSRTIEDFAKTQQWSDDTFQQFRLFMGRLALNQVDNLPQQPLFIGQGFQFLKRCLEHYFGSRNCLNIPKEYKDQELIEGLAKLLINNGIFVCDINNLEPNYIQSIASREAMCTKPRPRCPAKAIQYPPLGVMYCEESYNYPNNVQGECIKRRIVEFACHKNICAEQVNHENFKVFMDECAASILV